MLFCQCVTPIEDVIEALISLYNFQEYSSLSTDELVEKISHAIQDDEAFPEISDEEKQEFADRLNALLEFDNLLSITSNTRDVIADHERIFVNSRIHTDMRPIFQSDLEKGPVGVAIVHVLKINYEDSDGTHEFFLALNSIDLEQLRQQLDIADNKEKSIELMLDQAKISYLNYRYLE